MLNSFQLPYAARLQSWRDLRDTLENADIKTICVEVDKWWQSAPLVNHYLHPVDIDNWPGPWELIADNNYCSIARGLGMIYTLLLLGNTNIDFCLGKDDNSNEVVLVIVNTDHAKYVMNYWPSTVLNNNLHDFTILTHLDVSKIQAKL